MRYLQICRNMTVVGKATCISTIVEVAMLDMDFLCMLLCTRSLYAATRFVADWLFSVHPPS